MDIIKTIEENAEVEDFSDDSDAEVEVNTSALLFSCMHACMQTSMLRPIISIC